MSPADLAAAGLRRLDPERAHRLTILALKTGLGPRTPAADPILATEIAGIALSNCVGLAAGFDKDAEVPDAMLAAGFGFVECGTVTPQPQVGNPRPRLFRLTEDGAVINRMGFNNAGLEAFARRLARRRAGGVVGANLGANKDSADRIGDYVTGVVRLWPFASYFTINVSSPNTPGLRALQTREALEELLGRLAEARRGRSGWRPMFLKVAPDLDEAEIETIAEVAAGKVEGLIVSNTTLARPPLRSAQGGEAGGLSGAPLMEPSTRVLAAFHTLLVGKLPLIGAGGIASGADAYAKIRAGASVVQLYSALALHGPSLILAIRKGLAEHLKADGFANVRDAVGTA